MRQGLLQRAEPSLFATPPVRPVATSPRNQPASSPPEIDARDEPAEVSGPVDAAAVLALLRELAAVKRRLTALGVLRTGGIVGEYGEWLFARAFGWRLAQPSEKSFDAIDASGVRYQIKARQDSGRGGAYQLGIMRNMGEDGWDRLAAVVFDAEFTVSRAVVLPRALVVERAVFSDHQRGHLLRVDRVMLADARCEDVTRRLQAAQH